MDRVVSLPPRHTSRRTPLSTRVRAVFSVLQRPRALETGEPRCQVPWSGVLPSGMNRGVRISNRLPH